MSAMAEPVGLRGREIHGFSARATGTISALTGVRALRRRLGIPAVFHPGRDERLATITSSEPFAFLAAALNMSETFYGESFHIDWLHGRVELDNDCIDRRIRHSGSLTTFWRSCDRVDWLLAVLNGAIEDGLTTHDMGPALRKFARWCAAEAGVRGEDPLLVYATALAEGRNPSRAISELRDSRREWLAAVGSQGLPRCIPVAAASLAAWHAGTDDTALAAWWAADFAVDAMLFSDAERKATHWRWPGDRGEAWRAGWHTAAWLRAHQAEANRIREAGRARLARGLRFLIPNPF